MQLPKISIDNYQFTIVVYAALLFVGLNAFFTIPRFEDPKMRLPIMVYYAIYPGASPEDMEKLVVNPVEESLNEIEDIKKMTTEIENSFAKIRVEFDFGSDHDKKRREFRERIAAVEEDLPDDLYDTEIIETDISQVQIFQIALISDSIPYVMLNDRAERLKKDIERVPGIKKVVIEGVPEEQIRVMVDPAKLEFYRISVQDVMRAIQSANANIPGGHVHIGRKDFNVVTSGAFESIDDIKSVILHANGGQPVYVSDVATVQYMSEEQSYITRYNGKRAIFITANQKMGEDVFTVMDGVRSIINEASQDAPPGVEIKLAYDQSISVNDRVSGFASNLFQGIVLVALVIFLAVGCRAAAIVSMVIPMAFLIGLGIIMAMDYGLQQMTIAGMVVALGLLVDNAIVVMENIHKYLKKGLKGIDAAVTATSQVAWPIVSSTVTTALAFLPMLLMDNPSGEFIRSMPIMVVVTLFASLAIALSLTPLISSRFFASKDFSKANKIQRGLDSLIEGTYRKRLDWAFHHKWTVLIVAVLMFFASLMLFPLVGVSMFPKAEKDQFLVNLVMPAGTNVEATQKLAVYVDSVLAAQPEMTSIMQNVGRSNPVIYYNINRVQNAPNLAQFFVIADPAKGRSIEQIVTDLRADFGDVVSGTVEVKEFEQGPPTDAPIAIRVIGDEMDEIERLARQVELAIDSTAGTINIKNPLKTKAIDLHVNINREMASLLAVPIHVIDQTIRVALAGINMASMRDKAGDEFEIVVRYPMPGNYPTFTQFEQIYVKSMRGQMIPLTQLATIELKAAQGQIEHHKMDRGITVKADVAGRLVNDVTNEVLSRIERIEFPENYRYVVAGEREAQQESFGGMAVASMLAMFLIYGVLVLQFRSFVQPLIVFSALPLAIIGSLMALFLTGYSFSFTAFIGLTSLIGIVVNNSILLVEYTNQLRNEQGMHILAALKEACEARFTPIILTTTTTIGGLLPLAINGGTLWAPMSWTIIGGLTVSTFLTLLVVPILYRIYVRPTPKTI